MKRINLLISILLLAGTGYAQRLTELSRPLPPAVMAEAPMPEEMAAKYERTRTERHNKFLTPVTDTKAAVGATVRAKKEQYIISGDNQAFAIRYNPSDKYQMHIPNYRLLNTSHGREAVKGDGGKFNVKKDRISYAVISNGNEIRIINKSHKAVDMSEFKLTTESEAIAMNGNKIELKVPTVLIAAGYYPLQHKIECTHLLSGASYTFDLLMYWDKQLNLSGETHALALCRLKSQAADNTGVLCDLDSHVMRIVELPLVINGDGKDGANGKKGRYGANGTNQSSYKDKDGNTHSIAGTCGKPGEDGTDGKDGTDGGHFLFCLSPDFIETYGIDGLIATIDAGIGGKGGKGGEGGIHGKGSGCSGKANDGKDGKDGRDGQRGDFLYVAADVDAFIGQIFK
ncbi:MAG: hypothetical protein IJ814_06560 [Paludibacteraceae bacterium]|nr:hypothetical protein [Paludibacteraceae bacterium]